MRHLRFPLSLLLLAALAAACSDEESSVGVDLSDPATLYHGSTHVLYPDTAFSQIEDSLRTDGYSYGILGNLTDPVFGKTSAVVYTQIALPSNAGSIDFNEAVVDSVVLTLVKHQLYPDTAASYPLRLEVRLLAEAVNSDTAYYATSSLPVSDAAPLFDQTVTVGYTDTVIRLMLDPAINDVLRTSATAEEFIQHTKGLRIRVADGEGMAGIDFSANRTCLTAYYHNATGSTDINSSYTFLIGYGAAHFVQFTHDYTGTALASAATPGSTLDGGSRLYLEAMGGFAIHMAFDAAARTFAEAHPRAVVHYAELLLPLAPEASTQPPDVVMAMTPGSTGSWIGIPDLQDTYTLAGYDGTYDADNNRYRLRIPRHVQQLLRQGGDPGGMLLLLNSRRHSAYNTVINGIADTATAPKILFVYSE